MLEWCWRGRWGYYTKPFFLHWFLSRIVLEDNNAKLYKQKINSHPHTHTHTKEISYLTTHSTHFIYGYMDGRKEMFYITTHSTHFIYGYMATDIW